MLTLVLSDLQILIHSVLTIAYKHCHYLHITGEKTEAQKGQVTCSRSHS